MADKLNTWVYLRESPGTLPVAFGPESEDIPEWATKQLEEEGHEHLFGESKAAPVDDVVLPTPAEAAPVTGHVPGAGPLSEPAATELGRTEITSDEAPKRNASKVAWKNFADSQGVPVDDSMDRDDIIHACEEAGVLDES